ncbi:hypothetical protein D3X46_10505 [Acinetobacter baumannii]|nr:hypothetical protein D3X46_10505 [Acinetobacter baumannii]
MFGFNQKHNIVFEKQHIIKKGLCLFLIYKRKYFQNKLDEFWIKYIYLLFIKNTLKCNIAF